MSNSGYLLLLAPNQKCLPISDKLAKSQKTHILVIPVQTGIQYFQIVKIRMIPAFAGMTTFYETIISYLPQNINHVLLLETGLSNIYR